MTRKRIIILAVVVVAVGAIAFFQINKARTPIEVKTAKAVRGELEQVVSASGMTETAKEAVLNFESAGKVDEVYVKEGDSVKTGDWIASLDTKILSLQRKQQQAVVSQAVAAYQKLKNGFTADEIKLAQISVNTAQRGLDETKAKTALDLAAAQTTVDSTKRTRDFTIGERQEALADYNELVDKYKHPVYGIPNYTPSQEAEVDAAKATSDAAFTAYLTAQSAYEAAQKAYDQAADVADRAIKTAEDQLETANTQLSIKTAPMRSEDAKSTLAQVTQAKAALEIIDSQIDDATITAPFDGIIVTISAQEGEFVIGGAAQVGGFATISDPSTIRAAIDVDEADIVKVKPDQKATAFFDSYEEQEFKGRVTRVKDTSVKTEGGGTAFPVYIEIETAGKHFWQGMNVDVDIIVEVLKGKVNVPAEAVAAKDGKDIVYVVKDGKAKQTQVKLGASTDTGVEVISGVDEGDIIVTSNLSDLKDGARVKSK